MNSKNQLTEEFISLCMQQEKADEATSKTGNARPSNAIVDKLAKVFERAEFSQRELSQLFDHKEENVRYWIAACSLSANPNFERSISIMKVIERTTKHPTRGALASVAIRYFKDSH
ncbi:MAG: hypothetical protein AAFZ46_03180 [Pseudomonadota bacterium]